MVEATVQLGGDHHQGKRKTRRWKEAYEELKEMYGEENIIFPAEARTKNEPRLLCLVVTVGDDR